MLQWFKKNFEQFEGSSWYYEAKADEKIYQSSVEHIAEQMKLEQKLKLKSTIEELGFRQQTDYNGRLVLKNNIPIKKNMHYHQVQSLVQRLKQPKRSSHCCHRQNPSR